MEFRRIFLNRSVLVLLVCLLAADLFLFVREIREESGNHADGYTEELHEGLKASAGLSASELKKEVKKVRAAFMLAFYAETEGTDSADFQEVKEQYIDQYPELVEDAENGRLDREEVSKKEEILKTLADQKARLEEQEHFYEDMLQNAESIRKNPIFQNPEALENIEKTLRDYKPVEHVSPTIGDDRAVTMLFQSPAADFLILVFLIFICILFLEERKRGLWKAVHATPKGRADLAVQRVFILFLASIAAVGLLYGAKILVSFSQYDGFSQWNRPIQSVEGFEADWQADTVGSFLIRFLLVKSLAVFLFALVFWLMISVSEHVLPVLLLGAGLLVIEYLLYSSTSLNSGLVFWKTVNVFSFLNGKELFTRYENIRAAGVLVNVTMFARLILIPLVILSASACVVLNARMHPVRRAGLLTKAEDSLIRKTNTLVHRGGLFGSECYKVLIPQFGWIILAVLLGFFFTFKGVERLPLSGSDAEADLYYQIYEGEITGEKFDKLYAEEARLLEVIENEGDSYHLQDRLAGLRQVIENAERLKNTPGALLVSPFDWTRFWQNDSYHDLQALKMIFLTALMLGGVFAYERQNNMKKLLRSAPGGRRKLFWIKQAVAFLFGLLLFAGIYGKEIVEIVRLPRQELPAADFMIFRSVPRTINLGGMLWLLYLIRAASTILLIEATLLISRFCRKSSVGQITASVALTVPAALGYLGIQLFRWISFLPLLSVTGWLGRMIR